MKKGDCCPGNQSIIYMGKPITTRKWDLNVYCWNIIKLADYISVVARLNISIHTFVVFEHGWMLSLCKASSCCQSLWTSSQRCGRVRRCPPNNLRHVKQRRKGFPHFSVFKKYFPLFLFFSKRTNTIVSMF